MSVLGVPRQENTPNRRLFGLAQAEEEDMGRSRWVRSRDEDERTGKSDEGPALSFPLLPQDS